MEAFSVTTNKKIIAELTNISNTIKSNANMELPLHGVVLLRKTVFQIVFPETSLFEVHKMK